MASNTRTTTATTGGVGRAGARARGAAPRQLLTAHTPKVSPWPCPTPCFPSPPPTPPCRAVHSAGLAGNPERPVSLPHGHGDTYRRFGQHYYDESPGPSLGGSGGGGGPGGERGEPACTAPLRPRCPAASLPRPCAAAPKWIRNGLKWDALHGMPRPRCSTTSMTPRVCPPLCLSVCLLLGGLVGNKIQDMHRE